MLKRMYSKRSGFTLVEIIVAFAVFAIMASMIAQILEITIRARESNNLYAQELAKQERLLTIIEREKDNYNAATGNYKITLSDGTTFTMGYQVNATDPTAENQAEGLNYFLSPVDYTCPPASSEGGEDPESSDAGGGSQLSRMDTRITGTAGIGGIKIYRVVKDTHTYADDDPYKPAAGYTRYFIECAASSVNDDGDTTLREEDVPYAQYRLFFFSDQLDATKSSVVYTNSDGDSYTKNIYQEAKIVRIGHVNTSIDSALTNGVSSSNSSDGALASTNNPYTIQKLGNSVKISTPYVTEGGKSGVRFQGSKFTRFYVDFEGDPNLTLTSFGKNCTLDSEGRPNYTACPVYKETYNTDGTPKYEESDEGGVHQSIYGGFMYTRVPTTT